MSKVSFGSLNIKKVSEETVSFSFGEKEIEVKQYLPLNEKLLVISNAINNAADGNRFMNDMKLEACLDLEIMFAYTNITFTEKQREDLAKLYDILASNGFFERMYGAMNEVEYRQLRVNAARIAEHMYEQMNSVYGIMENISRDYEHMGEESEKIQKNLSDPNNLAFLKEVMTKMG